jgi:N-acetylglucosaminyl-diphospho-decaprenol L-rhamnosyltransferase
VTGPLTVPGSCACVIVHYGDPSLTLKAIESVGRGTARPGRVIVVDNAPHGLDPDRLPAGLEIMLLRPDRNLGFAGGVNLALAHLRDDPPSFVWLLNNDAVALPDTLAALLDAVTRLEGRALVSSLVLDEGGTSPWFHRARYLPWRLEGRHDLRPEVRVGLDVIEERPGPLAIPYLPGCSLVVPWRLLAKIGGLDPAFFVYGEDVDLSRRAQLLGWRLAVAHGSIVHHRGSASSTPARQERMKASTSLRMTARWFPWLVPFAVSGALLAGLKRGLGRRQSWWLTSRVLGYHDVLHEGRGPREQAPLLGGGGR